LFVCQFKAEVKKGMSLLGIRQIMPSLADPWRLKKKEEGGKGRRAGGKEERLFDLSTSRIRS
jgi:hypothetical protein